jgi:hypothetical protein
VNRLPDFLILGARRAGTTSLYDYLTQHPKLVSAKRKEVHYFDWEYTRGINWYRSRFPWSLRFRKSVLTGEATTYYLFHPGAPDRALETVPDAKLIALLRNPIDRAFSHYQSCVRRKWEMLSFEDAIEAEPGRIQGFDEKLRSDPGYLNWEHNRFSYIARGIYVDQLAEWRKRFDWDRFLILKSEDLYADPSGITNQTLRFLGLDEIELRTYPHRNRTTYSLKMAPETREFLKEYYRPHNERLYEMLGRDMGWDAR